MSKPKKSSKFIYRLKSVLKYREIREKQEQEKFDEAKRKLAEEEKREAELKRLEEAEYVTLRDKLSGHEVFNFQDIQLRERHLEVTKQKLTDQTKVREEAEEKKEEQREELVKSVKDKKIIERDQEKKKLEWRELMKKEEMKFLDEIASTGFFRQQKEAEEDL